MVDHYDVPCSPTPTQAHASSSSSVGSSIDVGLFERERNRLIQDISKGVESILGNSNVLNRKIEESISVGKEFHPISELWNKFEKIMVTSGIPNLYPQNSISTQWNSSSFNDQYQADMEDVKPISEPVNLAVGVGVGVEGSITPRRKPGTSIKSDDITLETGVDRIRFETVQSSLPPGVAPGGGRIYA